MTWRRIGMVSQQPFCALVLLCCCAYPFKAAAQLPKMPKISRFGIDGFRLILQNKGLRATQARAGTALRNPRETTAVILGNLKTIDRIQEQLHGFVNSGGTLLVASDLRGMRVPETPMFGTWPVVQELTNTRRRQIYGFQNLYDCPIVTKFNAGPSAGLFNGVESIVTNIPSALRCGPHVEAVAWLPVQKQPLMAVYQRGAGRMLFISDHSIFINEMLIHGDNALFANNVADWLCQPGNRQTLVLIHDGDLLADWSFGATPPAIPLNQLVRAVQRGGLENLPIADKVLPIVNQSVARYQRENGFNRDVRRFAGGIFGRRLIRNAMFLLTGLLIAAFIRWLMTRARPRRWLAFQDWRQPSEPQPVGAIRDKHFFVYLRTLCREFFLETGAERLDTHTPPIVHSANSANQTTRHVDQLWKVATGKPVKVSKRRFESLMAQLRTVRQLQLAGDLRLEWVAEAASEPGT